VKKNSKKLNLGRETIRDLMAGDLGRINAGVDTGSNSCITGCTTVTSNNFLCSVNACATSAGGTCNGMPGCGGGTLASAQC
jgi:hypothetical protein